MILGIDLGKKTTGIASSSGTIATPLATIKHSSLDQSVEKISKVANEEQAKIVIIGFVEGKIKVYFQDFAKKFKEKNPQIEIVMQDETLTSRQALETMINMGISKSKRKAKEHEIAASIILQEYLDSK